MGNKIKTEADRKASPRPIAPKGVTFTAGKGQKISLERGSHTRSKKNPGKRPASGFNWQIVGDRAATTGSWYSYLYRAAECPSPRL